MFRVTMVVEMVASQIGQNCNIKVATVDTVLIERMRRYFHHYVFALLLVKFV